MQAASTTFAKAFEQRHGAGESDLVNFGGYTNVKRDYLDGESSSHYAHTQVMGESTVGTEMDLVTNSLFLNRSSTQAIAK